MNKPAQPLCATSPAYEDDAYGWSLAQAALIRDQRLSEVDWNNVAEEIESVGRSERRSLESHLTQLLLHMMKWDAQPQRRGKSWFVSIENHRADALRDLRDNPSLKPVLGEIFADAQEDARRRAALETDLPDAVFAELAYTIEDAFERRHERPE